MEKARPVTPLENVWPALCRLVGEDVRPRTEHVAVDGKGRVTVTLNQGRQQRWFRFAGGRVRELRVDQDADLPLARVARSSADRIQRVLAYRPRRRIVLQAHEHSIRTVLKGYRRGRRGPAERAHAAAVAACGEDSFRVARILAGPRPPASIRFEELPGGPLSLSSAEAERFFSIGAYLRRFQAGELPRDIAGFGPDDELAVLRRWHARVSAIASIPAGWLDTYAELRRAAPRLPLGETGPAHRDLHDGQFLVDGAETCFLDFDLLARADVALDPANLLAHLTLRSLQGIRGATEASVNTAGERFLEGLQREGDRSFWVLLRFYQASTFLRLALVYRLRPRWDHLTDQLTGLARRCLRELLLFPLAR